MLESKAGFQALFEYATVGILVVGNGGQIELANPFIEKLFGYTHAELVRQPVEILIPETFRAKHVQYREAYAQKPKVRPMGEGLNLLGRRKDGSEFPVEISLGHYELEEKQLSVAFITDITERKRHRDELEAKVKERTLELTQSLEREKELNEMKSRFVSIASHEFRTPLSTILSSVALVAAYNKPEQEDKRKKHIDRINSAVQNLTNILNDYLSLDKLGQGKIEIIKESFDLHRFASDTAEELHGMLKPEQHINIEHTGGTTVFQDKKILKNVLLNLLSNAIKYSGAEQEINLSLKVDPHSVLIQVKDQGIGIPLEEQKNLFTKFFRAKNASNIQGTGLGLYIVSRYVELLDGNISFSSTPGQGSAFIVEFPQSSPTL
ncbi:MAG: PAS domain-containing sensor histidine kinase [Saprospiraceae bacterium]|nr:PAS domain-containing sensor histidine kinase [Saprospiraceae bacterium]